MRKDTDNLYHFFLILTIGVQEATVLTKQRQEKVKDGPGN